MRLSSVSLFLTFVQTILAATADEWRSRSIYQIMTDRYALANDSTTQACNVAEGRYCGGTWQGITNNLDYIQNMGFTAVWISPITANLPQYTSDLGSYHGYWQQNINDLNSNFGTVEDLQNLSQALHNRSMYLMVDIVVNNMAWNGMADSVQYDRLIPFNDAAYYHTYCEMGGNDSNTECWGGDNYEDGVTLPDLRTEDSNVTSIWTAWISDLVTTYNIDGLRVDSVGNINYDFLPTLSDAAGVFMIGEVDSGVVSYVCPYQTYIDSVLNYPVYFPLIRAFESTDGSMYDLSNEISWMQSSCKDTTILGSFSENHDQPRFPSYTTDMALVKNVLAFTFLADGIPIIYEGQEQHFSGGANPYNREAVWTSKYDNSSALYSYITAMNVFRSHVISVDSTYLTYQNYIVHNDTTTLAMRKGYNGTQALTVLTNTGSDGGNRSFVLTHDQTGFDANMVVTEIIGCTNSTVDDDGSLIVQLVEGLPSVYYPADNLVGSTVCVNGTTAPATIVSSDPPPAKGDGTGLSASNLCSFFVAVMIGVVIEYLG